MRYIVQIQWKGYKKVKYTHGEYGATIYDIKQAKTYSMAEARDIVAVWLYVSGVDSITIVPSVFNLICWIDDLVAL